MSRLRTLPEMVDAAADSEAGITFVAGPREIHRTYAELQAVSRRVASALRDAGFRRGDLVALVLPDAEQFLTALFGVSIAGAIPASIYPPSTVDLIPYLDATAGTLIASRARGVITTAALAAAISTLRDRCHDLEAVLIREDLDGASGGGESPPAMLDDVAFVQFTSGSTALPKGVALSHRNIGANVGAFSGPEGLSAGTGDVAVTWLPLYHDMGLVGMIFGAIHTHRPAVIMAPQAFVKRPVDWLRVISRHRGTISFAPTFGYDLCLRRVKDADLRELDLSCWRIAGCGAEPVHARTLAAFARRLAPAGFRASSLLPSYGLAEHVVAATLGSCGQPPLVERIAAETAADGCVATISRPDDDAAVEVVSCGRPLAGHQLRIVGSDGRALPDRHVGEIVLAGPSVMLGYYRRDALDTHTIREGWLYTGDLGYLSGGELFVCGRVKDVILVNGRKYHPQDLEWALEDLAGVRRGHVIAFGLSQPGQADRVVIVLEAGGSMPADALADPIRRRIGERFGLPVDDVAVVPPGTIGRTTSGKVQRAAAKARYLCAALLGGQAPQAET